MYEFQNRIRFSEVDEHLYLTLPGLVNYMQDCATFHGEETNVPLAWNQKIGRSWILTSLRFQVHAYPKFGDVLITRTEATGFRGCLGYRDFVIETSKGMLVLEGKSDWIFMDTKNRIPVNVPEDQAMAYMVKEEDRMQKLPEKFGKRKIRLPEGEGISKTAFRILESHLDANHHVNNGQYMKMAQYFLPPSFFPAYVRVEFRRQAYLGDGMIPKQYEEDGRICIVFENEEGEPFFIGEFRSRPEA